MCDVYHVFMCLLENEKYIFFHFIFAFDYCV
jgi:hypothetical protein